MNNELNITYEKLDKLDLCFEDISGECLYDSESIDEFCERLIEDIDEADVTEFKNACDDLIEKSKHLTVYEKDYFNMTADKIKEYIQDYADDNFGTSISDYDVQFSEKAEKLLSEFENELLNDNKIYLSGASVGFIDLSEYVQEAIKDYIEENPSCYCNN